MRSDELTRNALVLSQERLVRKLVSSWIHRFPHVARFEEDLEQEALLALVEAARNYRPELGAFSTFAWNRASGAIRRLTERLVGPVTSPRSEDWAKWEPEDAIELGADPRPALENRLDTERLLGLAETALAAANSDCEQPAPTSQRNVRLFLAHYLAGKSLAELARQHAISRQRAREVFGRMKQHFERWSQTIAAECAA